MLRVLRTRGLPRHLLRLLREVLGTMRIEDVSARLRVGLDDPADTGILFSVLGPALGAFILPRSSSVSIEPSPARQLEGHARGTIRLRPIRLAPPLVRFAFSRPALRAAGALLRPDGNRRRRS